MAGAIAGGGTAAAPGQTLGVIAGIATPNSVAISWSAPASGGAPVSYTVQYRITGTTAWGAFASNITITNATITGLSPATNYDFSVFAVNQTGTGALSAPVSAETLSGGNVTSITWNLVPSGHYALGSGAIGVNALVTPAAAAIQFGFSTSASVAPVSWTLATHANTNLWAAYVPAPTVAGTWFAWAEGTDGSAPTVSSTSFTVS